MFQNKNRSKTKEAMTFQMKDGQNLHFSSKHSNKIGIFQPILISKTAKYRQWALVSETVFENKIGRKKKQSFVCVCYKELGPGTEFSAFFFFTQPQLCYF